VKILLVAPGVNGQDVGEAWVGFQWASRLSARHEVTLLTYRQRRRGSVRDQLPGVEVVEWLEPPLIGRAERFNSLLKPWYPSFHSKCRAWMDEAQSAGRTFDVGHQPTPVAMRYPSPLTGSGIPFVIGPVGGGLETPPGFAEEDTAPWYVGLRHLDQYRLRHDRWLRRTYEQADVVAGIAAYVEESLASLRLRRFVRMSETGLAELPPTVVRDASRTPVRLLFVGRLIRTKGARDAIRAMGLVRDLPVVLDVVGDGFDREACEQLVDELELVDRVVFHGHQQRDAVDGFYRDSDVFVFPSYREPGGNAPYEAMGHGLAMIVSDRGGPAAAVTDACGFRVAPESPAQFAHGIAQAIRELVESPGLRERMGRAAREQAEADGTWAARIAQMERVYADIAAAAH
jgi:glycosyltransferase involved in cell wall biosynthesis